MFSYLQIYPHLHSYPPKYLINNTVSPRRTHRKKKNIPGLCQLQQIITFSSKITNGFTQFLFFSRRNSIRICFILPPPTKQTDITGRCAYLKSKFCPYCQSEQQVTVVQGDLWVNSNKYFISFSQVSYSNCRVGVQVYIRPAKTQELFCDSLRGRGIWINLIHTHYS